MDAKETYGVEVAYTESIDQVNYESSVREYAAAGYDLILAVGPSLPMPASLWARISPMS